MASVGPNEEPIATPSYCLKNSWSNKINDSGMVLVSISQKESFDKWSTWVLSLNKFSMLRWIVSCKRMLVKSDSISKLAITSLESKLWSSSANVKESLIVYLLVVMGSSIGIKNFLSFYVGVPMADKIGLKDGRPSLTILWTLAEPYIIPSLEPEWLSSLYCSMEISYVSKIFKNIYYSIFHMDQVI